MAWRKSNVLLYQTCERLKELCTPNNLLNQIWLKPCSSQSFDTNEITKSNQENKSFDGLKNPVKTKTVASKSKTAKSVTAIKEEYDVMHIPDWFSAILTSPMYSGKSHSPDEIAQFKEFLEEQELLSLPTVRNVLQKTMPFYVSRALDRWKERKIQELGGEEQFKQHQAETLQIGSDLHSCIEKQLKGETDFTVLPENAGHWESMQAVFDEVGDVLCTEDDCVHPEMFYSGKFDCIAQLRDKMCLIEWKTSTKHKPLLSNTFDNPLQVAAYIGAVNRSGVLQRKNVPDLTTGAIVIAYPSGAPATVHMMNQRVCEKYWAKWTERLFIYWALNYPKEE